MTDSRILRVVTAAAALVLLGAQCSAGRADAGPLEPRPAAYDDATVEPPGLAALCPCRVDPFFDEFLSGERELQTCTDDAPTASFVRLVAMNIDLVVLFSFGPREYCGWQPAAGYTSYLPITTAEWQACRRLFHEAARNEGVPCVPE